MWYYSLEFLVAWSSLGFFSLLVASVLVLFSHSWTWFIFAFTLGVFLLLQWRLAARDRGLWSRFKIQAILISSSIGVGLLSDLMRKLISPISSVTSVIGTAQSSFGFPNAAFILSGLRQAVDFTLGGVFSNQLFVFLSIVGFLVLLKFKSEVSNFFVAWIFVVCVSILFAGGDFIFDRFLFLFPWIALSSLGLFFVVRLVGAHFGGWRGWQVLVLTLVFLVLLNGSLRFIFNINVW